MNNKWIIDNSKNIDQLTIEFDSIGEVVMKPFSRHELYKCQDGDKVLLILNDGQQYHGIFREIDDCDEEIHLTAFSDTTGLLIGIPRHAIYGFFKEIIATPRRSRRGDSG